MSVITSAPAAPAIASDPTHRPRRGVAFWIGWVLSVLVAAMLAMGGVMDLLKPPFVIEGLARAGFKEEVAVPLGIVVILSAVLYLIPRTAMFGAALFTAYLGGAVTVHTQLGEYGMLPAPIIVAVVMWVALVLRDRRVRAAVFG